MLRGGRRCGLRRTLGAGLVPLGRRPLAEDLPLRGDHDLHLRLDLHGLLGVLGVGLDLDLDLLLFHRRNGEDHLPVRVLVEAADLRVVPRLELLFRGVLQPPSVLHETLLSDCLVLVGL